jgi:hypothetical protein
MDLGSCTEIATLEHESSVFFVQSATDELTYTRRVTISYDVDYVLISLTIVGSIVDLPREFPTAGFELAD